MFTKFRNYLKRRREERELARLEAQIEAECYAAVINAAFSTGKPVHGTLNENGVLTIEVLDDKPTS